MYERVVIDASVLLAIALPDPQANKDYAMALLFAIDKGDIAPVLAGSRYARWTVESPLVCGAHRAPQPPPVPNPQSLSPRWHLPVRRS